MGKQEVLQKLKEGNIVITHGTSQKERQAVKELITKGIAEIKKEKSWALIIGLKEATT